MSELKKTDLAPDDFLKNVIPSADEIKMLREMDEVLKSIAKSAKENISKAQTADNKQRLADIKAEQAEQVKLEKIAQEKIRTMQRESQLRQTMNREQKQKEAQDAREKKAAEQLNSAYARQSKTLNDLRKRYKDLAIEGKANTTEAKSMLKEIRSLDSQLKKVDATVGQHQRNVGNYRDALKGATNMLQGFGLALGGVAIARNALGVLTEFDEKLADIAKTTGLTTSQAKELSIALFEIDTRSSITELQELASAAGRLGIQGKENIIGFVTAADKAFVALGDDLGGTAEEIATNLGKISATFGAEEQFGVQEGIERTGSVMNELAANSKASAGAIFDFTQRMAGVASQAGIAQTDIQALGALFDSTGQSIEVAASTLSKLLPELAKNQEEFAKVAGVSGEAFGLMLKNNPVDALKAVAVGAKSSEGGLIGLNETLEKFGVDSARAAGIVGILASETDNLTNLQNIASKAFEENTSLTNEFNTKNETLSATFEKLAKKWDEVVVGINEGTGATSVLKSVIVFLTDNLETFVKIIGIALTSFASWKATIIATRAAMTLYTSATSLMSIAMGKGAIATKVADVAMKSFNTTTKSNPLGLLVTLIATAVTAWFAFADGATAAEKAQNALNESIERSGNVASTASGKINKIVSDRIALLDKEARLRKANGEDEKQVDAEILEAKKELYIESNDLIDEEIKRIRQRAKETIQAEIDITKARDYSSANRQLMEAAEAKAQERRNKGEIDAVQFTKTVWEEYFKLRKMQLAASTNEAIKELEKEKDANKKTLEELAIEYTEKEKEKTEGTIKAAADRQKELDILRRRAEDIEDSLIEDEFERKEQKLWRQFEREMEAIKGQSEVENRLRKDLQMQLDAELLELEKERNRKRQEEAVKFAEWWEKFMQDIDAKEARMRDEEFNAEIEAREKQSKRVQLETLKNTDLTADEVARLEKERLVELLEEKIKIYKAYGKDTIDLEIELQNAKNDLNQKELKSEQDHAEALKVVADSLTDYWQKQFDKRLELIDKEQQAAQKQADFYRELAAQGNIDAQQSILEAQRVAEQAERERQRVEQQKARLQLITSGLSTYQSKVAAGDPNPLASTITEVTLLSNFLSTLPAFFEGIEDTGKGGGLDGKGGFLSVLHPNERVMPAKDNKKVTGLSNTELADVGYKYRTGQLIDIHKVDTVGSSFDILPLLKKQDELIKALKDKNEIDYRIDEVVSNAFSIIKTQKKGKEVVTTKTRLRS